ncbi:MAG: hypothetical protein WDN26_19820 [Chitinophagaceae bacterium]
MTTKTEPAAIRFIRSLAIGVLLSMLFFYSTHVFGTWQIENYRPDPETTGTVLLHNKCAVFGNIHTLRPNTEVSGMGEGIDGTKLSGSFMIFFDGHIDGMVILSLLLGVAIFALRNMIKNKRQSKTA